MSEIPSWMNPAYLADARAAVGLLPNDLQEILHDLAPEVITALHSGKSTQEIFLQIRLLHPEASDALESLDEVPESI